MNPVILGRFDENSKEEDNEKKIASQYFPLVNLRTLCKNQLVIGRYSVLPFYQELENDLKSQNCRLINTFEQHNWVANFDYYEQLKNFTFKSWSDRDFYLCDDYGPFVVKGRTNSKKHQWNTMMFAETRRRALEIASDLINDGLIGSQGLIFRKFIPLKKVSNKTMLNGLPLTNEWRLFYYRDKLLSFGFYWTEIETNMIADAKMFVLAEKIAKIAKDYINFYVMDLAETEEGEWVLVELNDAQMSGLSYNDPDILYRNLLSNFMFP